MAVYTNLSVDQGTNFSSAIAVEQADGLGFDLTGYVARGQIRKTYVSTSYVNFDLSIPNPTDGVIALALSAAQTARMKPGRYQFDIEIANGTVVQRVIEGQLEINPRITRV